jgi:hypothetical protein
MKIKSVVLALLMSALPVFATTAYPLTTPFASGPVAVTFPTPDDNTKGIETSSYSDTTNTPDHTGYTGHAFSATTSTGKAYFAVSYFDYGSVRGTDVANLDRACDGGLEKMNLVLVPDSRENTSFAGLFAREAEGVSAAYDGFIVISTVGTRAYIGVVLFDKAAHATRSDANDFFASVHQR